MARVGIDAISGTTGTFPRMPAQPDRPPMMNSNDILSYPINGSIPISTTTSASPVATTSPTYQSTFGPGGNWGTFVSSDPQLQAAAQQMMPMYQARLGGLQGPVAEAMRTRGMEQIQSQYGTALRSAMNQAGAQGIRGPAAIAMQQDIRDQMGRATAGYQRDLTIADWDAKRQALADYYNTMQGERGIRMSTPIAQQQLANTQQGFNAYNKALSGMAGGGGGGGSRGQGIISRTVNPTISQQMVSPQTMLGLPEAPGVSKARDTISGTMSRWGI